MTAKNGKTPRTRSHVPTGHVPQDEPAPRAVDGSASSREDASAGSTEAQTAATVSDGQKSARDRGPRGPFAPEIWDRQPGESEAAYRAFCAFRDMGADRNVRDAYRLAKGKPDAIAADGTWTNWSLTHDWPRRALAWDNRLSAARTRAAERAAEKDATRWAQRLVAQAEADFAFAQKYAGEMARRLNSPLLAEMPARELKDCVAVTVAASQLAWAAIAQALPDSLVDFDFDPATATTEQLTEAIGRIEAVIGPAPAHRRMAR